MSSSDSSIWSRLLFSLALTLLYSVASLLADSFYLAAALFAARKLSILVKLSCMTFRGGTFFELVMYRENSSESMKKSAINSS